MLGFRDCFYLLGWAALLGIPIAAFTRSFKPGGGAGGGH
jgi:hypothetical protein